MPTLSKRVSFDAVTTPPCPTRLARRVQLLPDLLLFRRPCSETVRVSRAGSHPASIIKHPFRLCCVGGSVEIDYFEKDRH